MQPVTLAPAVQNLPLGHKLMLPHPKRPGEQTQFMLAGLTADGCLLARHASLAGHIPAGATKVLLCLATGDSWFAGNLDRKQPA